MVVLARVDAVTWFVVIGICQYGFYTNDVAFALKFSIHIENVLRY
jgi:hypothetical protein